MAEEPARPGHALDQIFYVSPEQWKKTQEELAEALKARERIAGIVQMCYLDNALERLLRTVMIEDESVIKQLMKDDRLLGSFSSKLKLAYALGLIPELVREDLECLNAIRNRFAHEATVMSFDHARVCGLCKNLSTAKQIIDGEARPPASAHDAAVVDSWLFLETEIQRREDDRRSRPSPLGDPVEWLERLAAYMRQGIISRKQLCE